MRIVAYGRLAMFGVFFGLGIVFALPAAGQGSTAVQWAKPYWAGTVWQKRTSAGCPPGSTEYNDANGEWCAGCPEGYGWTGGYGDPNACHRCDPGYTFKNFPDGFFCYACPSGYDIQAQANGHLCVAAADPGTGDGGDDDMVASPGSGARRFFDWCLDFDPFGDGSPGAGHAAFCDCYTNELLSHLSDGELGTIATAMRGGGAEGLTPDLLARSDVAGEAAGAACGN